MAPLPPENTPRYKVIYQQGPYQHSFEVRCSPSVTPAQFGPWLGTFLTDIGPALFTLTVTEVLYAGDNQTFFNPVNLGLTQTEFGGGAVSVESAPKYLDFVGRSTGGRRTRLALFGYQGPVSDWRVLSNEDVHVMAAVLDLNSDPDIGLAIDQIKAIWKPYANMGYNSHWQRSLRT